ncbi:CobW family GTP-binding protein [Catenulispora pinisilvae]|uniref:CobW family GTP-binding protein n=1 Tax=Catenulispora pinisilvae TaxID=2705253 RepID=UPI002B269D56|nr:GTP-binding protein [Catenulispora pinisilvae]
MSVADLLPVVIVTGLHREQRRQAVRELFRQPGAVVLHHDLSKAGEGEVIRQVWERDGLRAERVPLVNDCPCCALREDLLPLLVRLAVAGRHRLAIVDLWDGSDPEPLVATIAGEDVAGDRRMDEFVKVVGVVAAVDPLRVVADLRRNDALADHGLHTGPDDEGTIAETLAHQIEYANVLAVGYASDADEHELRTGLAMLRRLSPTARALTLQTQQLVPAALAGFDVEQAAQRVDPALALLPTQGEDDGVHTLVWRRRRPLHPGRLYEALEQLVPVAERSRGRFWLANRPGVMLAWDAAGASLTVGDCGPWLAALSDAEWEEHPPERRAAAAMEWDPRYGDRVQLLSFTSPGLDIDAVAGILDDCLLTDDEVAAGEPAWRGLPDAFEELLDPVA